VTERRESATVIHFAAHVLAFSRSVPWYRIGGSGTSKIEAMRGSKHPFDTIDTSGFPGGFLLASPVMSRFKSR
jgi:hypothetical protein